jgi:hypothetical protein
MTDTEIKIKGMEILTKNMGLVETERFISLIQREKFDYTKWQRHLFKNLTIKEISKKATEYMKNQE